MTTEELAKTEMELYSFVLGLNKKEKTGELGETLKSVFALYNKVHKSYSFLAKEEDEALKRGLFIQWYAATEPSYLTGIEELDEKAEQIIIDLVEKKINNNSIDNEFKWMLNYYASWDFVFNRYKKSKGLAEVLANSPGELPAELVTDKATMDKRGQMGIYWNSLNHFKNTEINAGS